MRNLSSDLNPQLDHLLHRHTEGIDLTQSGCTHSESLGCLETPRGRQGDNDAMHVPEMSGQPVGIDTLDDTAPRTRLSRIEAV